MSLIFGFHKEEQEHEEHARLDHQHNPVEQSGTVKTFTKTMTLSKYDNKNIVKVFSTGILLTGITTTSVTSAAHTGLVYYDVHEPDGCC